MRFPQTFIDDLRRQADIIRIIQDYVTLKKKGANWMACCPFHKEKTPSFSVSPSKGIFYCFGCQKGGSVFNFVMEIERVPFPEAIRIVAEKSAVPLPKMMDDSRFESHKREADDVIELNKWALDWWVQQLSDAANARIARQYLEQRQITTDTAKTFRLGYAPDRWDALSSYLKWKGASQFQIDRSGLVVKKDSGSSYDRFRARLVFPVFDIQNRPVAFGARTLKNEDAKYINSPETPAYVKGRHLFGLNLTREDIRRQGYVTLVEGYMDLIVLYQLGVRNIVASLGTSLTSEQAKLIGRFARRVLVNYDGDDAGIQATKRAGEILLAEEIEVGVLVIDNADPDEFILREGVEEYERQRKSQQERSMSRAKNILGAQEFARKGPSRMRIRAGLPQLNPADEAIRDEEQGGAALSFIDFVINQAVRERNLHEPKQKAEAVSETLPFLAAIKNRIERREYFDNAIARLQIREDQRRELWRQVRGGTTVDVRTVQQLITPTLKPTVAEEKLLELLLGSEELRRIVLPRLEASDYQGLATAPIFRALAILNDGESEVSFDSLSAQTADDPSAGELLARLMIAQPIDSFDDALTQADSCLNALRLMKLDRRIDELSSEVAEAERAGEAEKRDKLSMQLLELSKQRSDFLPSAQMSKSVH